MAEPPSPRAWGFQTMLLVSGASDLETTTKSELLQLLSSEPRLGLWTRSCSFHVVTREDVEELARKTKSEELEAAGAALAVAERAQMERERAEQDQSDGVDLSAERVSIEPAGTDNSTKALVGGSLPQSSVAAAPALENFELTPQILANAFQRFVNEDKKAFLATLSSAPAADEGSPPVSIDDDSTSSPLTEFLVTQESESIQGLPARIYLLVQYPLSLGEMQALLRTGEADATAFQGDLPLLPLIDGALLVVDPARSLQERRKSLSLGEERRKSISQKHLTGLAIEKALGPAAAVPSAFQSANPLLKACYEASSVGGLEWSDFVFAELPCSAAAKEPKGLAELAKDLLVSVQALAAQKYEFKHWVSTTTIIPIPAYCPENEDTKRTLDVYELILSSVYEASVGVSTVLFSMKEAVVVRSSAGDGNSEGMETDASNQSYVEEFITHNDVAALRLAVAYTTFAKEQLAREATGRHHDDPCSVLGHKIGDAEKAMWAFSDLPGVGNSGRKGMPITPQLMPTERSIKDTEFALFSNKFSVASVHLTRQLLQFEELLGPAWKGKLQQTRAFVEQLDHEILPQRLAQIMGNFPTLYKHYDVATDSLLVATLAATAPGRFRTTTWSAKDHVRHRPAFKDWKKEQLVANEYLTPRTMKALGACVPLSSAELSLLSEKTSVLFPSDQSVIRLYQTPRGGTWLNVYQGGDVFGFRQIDKQQQRTENSRHAMQFCASFDDDSQLHICEGQHLLMKKPDGFPTITTTNTFPNGLTVTACSDGTIVQQYVSAQRQSCGSSAAKEQSKQIVDDREVYRLIVGKGTVLREFASGERVVLLANGDVQRVARASRAASKSTAAAIPDDEESEGDKPLRVVDPATNALVEKRPDGVVIITHTDGSRITNHSDGTRMLTNGAKSHVLVKKAGFADVCIDMQVNLTAQRHAKGERVAVTKGGLRTRSTVDVYDGTRIEIGYNTKVVAQVNGRVTTCKPSGICIVAKDSGRIEYQSPRSIAATSSGHTEDDDLDVTNHNGVYYFDCLRGRFELCDLEQNQFTIDFGESSNNSVNTGSPRVSIDLAGVVSDADAAKYEVGPIPAKAVVNDPIEPHLLILNGDGTGKEILRPRDIEHFLREGAALKKEVYSAFESSASPSSSGQNARVSITQHRVFFQEVQQSSDTETLIFNDRKLHSEFTKLLQPVNAAAKYLQRFYYPSVQAPVPQFTIVRKLQQIQPLDAQELQEMHLSLKKWQEWQEAREVNKDQYKVVDPRDDDTIAQQMAVQKKVLAAYKATRSRKKLEKQKARELLKKKQQQQLSQGGHSGGHLVGAAGVGVAYMETVQEGDEPHVDDKDDDNDNDDSDGDDFENLSSDGSTNGDDLGEEVDDPEELLWTAFAEADALNTGKLSIAQTRQALVHVLGVGVPTAEILTALQRYKLQDPQQVSFDTFADLASALGSEGQDTSSISNYNSNNQSSPSSSPRLPVLEGIHRMSALIAAGSATEAIRIKQQAKN